ncbi:MAG: SPOR domain-containing protein [Sphingomonadales bacterium]|nr:SPOR domain-containing protein [Sphingomonadales bacterium]MDE2169417.1 SPOR domain-containing protein [Sphingomonadales bacterium]
MLPTSVRNPSPLRQAAPARLAGVLAGLRLPLGGALALALISTGWSTQALARRSAASAAIDSATPAQAIIAGEAAVLKDPRDATLRAALGRAYLRGGRFESAASVLADAMTLGDSSPRTVLSLALARTAIGQQHDALTLLHTVQDKLPAADYGLAVALAGDPQQGIAVLSAAARAGQSTEKLRQNLAYSYALDGRWSEARTLVAMDLPPNRVDSRLTQWAASARPEAVRDRVAALLGAPVIADSGMSANLALGGAPAEHLAVKTPSEAPVSAPLPLKELPAVSSPSAVSVPVVEPLPAPEPEQAAPARAVGGMLASADAPVTPPSFTPVAPQGASQPVSNWSPISKPVASPLRVAEETPREARSHTRAAKPVVKATIKMAVAKPRAEEQPRVSTGSHMVQLGAFSSQANAERARKLALAHRSELRSHDIIITKAVVNGRDYWRVAAAGFDSNAANGVCGRWKKSGGACFAYETGHLPAGEALAMAVPERAPGHKR